MRYAHKDDQGRTFSTHFIDISQTGLAFVTDRENAPQLSDLIKVEIPLDNKETIAWWARVVRVEEYQPHKWYMNKENFQDENQVLVAITFHELPSGHARQIRETLNRKFDEIHKNKRAKKIEGLALLVVSRFWSLLFYGFCIFATFWLLYYLSRPDANYDAKKGAPWGRRFEGWYLPAPKPKPVPKQILDL